MKKRRDLQFRMPQRSHSFDAPLSGKGLLDALSAICDRIPVDRLERIVRRDSKAKTKASTLWWSKYKLRGLARLLQALQKNRAAEAGYSLRALWAHRDAETAYSMLLRAIRFTGEFHRGGVEVEIETEGNRSLVAVAFLLAELARCHCWTAFDWDKQLGQPRLVGSGGLHYPETIIGSLGRAEFVRRQLLSDEVKLVDEVKREDSNFTRREHISSSWIVHLRCDRVRALVFLNWRDGVIEIPPTRACNRPWEVRAKPGAFESGKALDYLRASHPAEEEPARPLEPKDLLLAARYVSGWLSSQKVAEDEVPKAVKPTEDRAITIAESLVKLFADWSPLDGTPLTATLSKLEQEALRPLLREIKGVACVARCTEDGRRLIVPSEVAGGSSDKDVRLEPVGSGVLVEDAGSLMAQSLVLRTSILIRDLDNSDVAPVGDSLLRVRLRWPEQSVSDDPESMAKRTRSELAVPILAGGAPFGAIAMSASQANVITRRHVRWLEAITLLYGALVHFHRSEAPKQDRAFLNGCLRGRQPISDVVELLRAFTTWLLTTAGVEYAFVLLYDSAAHALRPVGVSLTPDLAKAAMDSMAHQGLDQLTGTTRGGSKLVRALVPVVAEALTGRLVPSPDGKSWSMFRGEETQYIGIRPSRLVISDGEDDRIRSAGFLLQTHPAAAPDGVVWMGRRQPGEGMGDIADKLDRIRYVTQVVASIVAVHRLQV